MLVWLGSANWGTRIVSVIMCAEAVWWRCHRRIIADYLIAASETVFHILGPNRIERARITEGVQFEGTGSLTYPLERSRDSNKESASNRQLISFVCSGRQPRVRILLTIRLQ